MPLSAGARLGPYEILSPLGAGGMGEVYRAKDTRLGREVAVKVLPAEVAGDPERLRRFEQEAKAASALNHPGILTVHDFGSHDGVAFLVTELLDGESLRDMLRRGPLPQRRALELAAQIARGLAAAHDRGIVHRDLKPENLFVTRDGRMKILDFGLARVVEPANPTDPRFAEAPTVAAATEPGTVLGTPGYMAPEQARGEPADERADLFALGCVLYEALAGRPAFRRASAAETLSAVLRDEPQWDAMPAVAPGVRRLLDHLLAKEARERRRDAADVAIEIDDLVAEPASEVSPPRPVARRRPPAAGLVAALALLGLGGWLASRFVAPLPAPSSPGRPVFELVPLTSAEAVEEWPTFAPDGRSVAFVREAAGLRQLFVREIASGAERQLTRGDHDHLQPAFLPSGDALLVVRARDPHTRLEPDDPFGEYGSAAAPSGDVWRLDLVTGAEQRLVEGAFHPDPSPDGSRLVVEADWSGTRRLWLVDARGANREQLTTDTSEAMSHLAPRFSPDGTRVAFQLREWTTTDIRTIDLATRRQTAITRDTEPDYYPDWSADGRALLFSSYRSGGINLWRAPLAADGSLAGMLEQLTQGAGQDVQLATAPAAGGGVAFSIQRQNASLWRMPLDPATGRPTGAPEPFISSSRENSRGAWSPDGRTVAFNSDREGEMNLWLHDVASGAARRLTVGAGGDYQPDWSPDGGSLVFFSARSGSPDIWRVEVATGELRRLTEEPGIEINPFFSPAGDRIAYQSDATGRFEIWLLELASGERRQLTRDGVSGHYQRWSRDGRHLVVPCACGRERQVQRIAVADGSVEPLSRVRGGGHISLLPDERTVIDALGHRGLWRFPLAGGEEKILEFDDPQVRIDYPVVSSDGRWVLFDRLTPQGGDIWLLRPKSP